MKPILALILLFLSMSLFGQNRYNIDSLNQVYRTAANDTVKIKTLQWIFDNYLYSNPDSTQFCYREMFKIGKKSKWDYAYYNAYLHKATHYWSVSKMDSVILAMEGALKHAIILKDDSKTSNCYVRLAMAQSHLGNYSVAKELTYKALEIAKRNNDWEGLYFSYYRLGNTFYYENDFDNALQNYLKVDSIFQHHERKEPALAASLSNIGQIYMELGNFDKSEEYFLRSKEQYRLMNRREGEVYIKFNMGKLEFNKGNYQNCIDSLIPVLNYYSNVQNTDEVSDISGWIGASYLKLKNYPNAKKYYEKSVNLANQSNSKMQLANGLVGLAEVAKHYGNPNRAIMLLKRALEIYDEMNISYNKSQILKNLSTAHLEKKDYRKALEYLEAFQSLKDSITKAENAKNVHELEAKYENEKKTKEIALLTSQNQLVAQQKKNQRNLFLGGLCLTSLVGVFFFILYRNRQKTNKKLKEIDVLKSNFFANISHEFRTPLTLISAPLEKKLESEKLNNTDRTDFEMMQRNSKRLLNLVDQLLDLSKLESGHLKLRVSRGDLTVLLKSIASSFVHLAKSKKIEYTVKVETTKNAWFDKNLIEKTVINLLSNAFKYTPENGVVNFKSTIKNSKLEILVENSSPTFSNEKIDKIFNRFYQADENADGIGIGLSLVKELVTLAHGTIHVEITKTDTVLFKVILPISEKAFYKNELVPVHKTGSTLQEYKQPVPSSTKTKQATNDMLDEDAPILLIVEDNADVNAFIKNSFSNTFQVLEAENGKIGIEKAIEFVPDIIISDIMMPVTDGLELCKQLKLDERTCHIPIILLTAKAGEESQYKGMETGADDYITKPFKIKMVETRVQNLIASRKLLRNRYSQEVVLKPKDIAITNLDEQFLEKVQQVLDEKLTEPSFSVEKFSAAVGMSRMQLHRKLKALTDLSASEFIRSQRLKLAASLLQKSDANISEIGYTVGFNDHAYFSKCFKEAYGCSPSEYISK
ncbi:tetratricopeptide repeat protein [Hwangdonia lutea]|uniref:histidine kinase n=1 Tax=Hwangdonia lutea TaxID=3075823 RepID=A0AA97HQC9_9FLAO|nr:tetratricopeptide repeat protein [Hwangdonia sp. SCSIO 19198]WOD43517.1 tetratricopeptide repeat protein [Hwangdonia sp. SCSIO 19198]